MATATQHINKQLSKNERPNAKPERKQQQRGRKHNTGEYGEY